MSEKKYHVCLSVPLGKRDGIMLIRQVGSSITGWLDIMGKKNALSGMILADGQIELSGLLQTLMSTIPYTATGTINRSQLQLSLKTAPDVCYLLSGEEINPYDKVL